MAVHESYHTTLRRRCPMSVQKWRALKGLVYVLIMAIVALVGIVEEGPLVAITFMLGAVLVFGVEVTEIQVMDWVNIQFEGEVEAEQREDG